MRIVNGFSIFAKELYRRYLIGFEMGQGISLSILEYLDQNLPLHRTW